MVRDLDVTHLFVWGFLPVSCIQMTNAFNMKMEAPKLSFTKKNGFSAPEGLYEVSAVNEISTGEFKGKEDGEEL